MADANDRSEAARRASWELFWRWALAAGGEEQVDEGDEDN